MRLEDYKNKYKYDQATPVMRQYLDIKFTNYDCLILFRMGDFYELFYEDAITASRVLGIALTKKGKNTENEIPMCGVPHHAIENYLNKLLGEEFKVAICDQMETPEEAKKNGGYKAIVNRSVTRIITPGTILEESLLETGKPSYLVALHIENNQTAFAVIDLSTSECYTFVTETVKVIDELAKISPKELLLAEKYRSSKLASQINSQLDIRISFQVDSFFTPNRGEKNILDFYNINSTQGIGELSSTQISAIGGLIEYITLTQKGNVKQLPYPKIINSSQYMDIDLSTRRNLEIISTQKGQYKGSLISCIDKCITKTGKRLLHNYLSAPLNDIDKINSRLDITEFFIENTRLTGFLRNSLKETSDLERCMTRIHMGRSTPKDLLSVKYTIGIAMKMRAAFVQFYGINLPKNIEIIVKYLIGLDEIYDLIDQSISDEASNNITDGNIIRHSYHPRIRELFDLINNSSKAISDLKDRYRKETGVETLKISQNNVIGMFIEVTSKNASKITGDAFVHKQSTANATRYTTVQLQELESAIINARGHLITLEGEIYKEICDKVLDFSKELNRLARAISHIDLFTNFATIATTNKYCKPELSNDIFLEIHGGRHPSVEESLKSSNENFTENDCNLDLSTRIKLITGPNMAGKSTYLRQNAIIILLAHIGSYVPATKAHIGIVDKIFSRVGAGDDLNQGQSTFMTEMLETSAILAQATHRSFIILDEVGRGTSTYDGVSIAWAVLEHLHDKVKSRCLFATHYHELTSMEKDFPAILNYTVDIKEHGEEIIFLHKIIPGHANRSYGIHVAKIAGMPSSVINRANELLKNFEKKSLVVIDKYASNPPKISRY